MKLDISYNILGEKNKISVNPSYIRNFYFIEDIESPIITGQFQMNDPGGIIEKLPITGNEKIEIELIQENKTNKDKIFQFQKKIKFDIFDMKMEIGTTGKNNIYTFLLVEEGYYDLINTYYSCAYKQKTIKEIIESICKNQLNFDNNKIKYNIEETTDKIDFIIPYWKPITTIKYLSKLAKRTKSPKESGFIFYSNLGEETEKTTMKNFTSFASLLEQKSNKDIGEKYYLRNPAIPVVNINNILEVENPKMVNKYTELGGKTYYGINFLNDKKVLKQSLKLSNYVNDSIFLGKNLHVTKEWENESSDIQFKGYYNKELILNEIKHNFRLAFENTNERIIYCKGILNRYAGKMIEIEESSGKATEMLNENYSGTWLIKKIIHNVIAGDYEHKMTILKNSYGKSTDDKLLTSSKSNT